MHRVCACTWTRAVLNVGLDTQSEKEERTRATRSASKREDSVLRPRGGMTFVAVSREREGERERGDGRAGMSKYAMWDENLFPPYLHKFSTHEYFILF